MKMLNQDTIVALATASGAGAVAIVRVSGSEALPMVNGIFRSVSQKDLTRQKTHTLHLGFIADNEKIIDQVLVSVLGTQTLIQEKMLWKFPVMALLSSNNKLYSCSCEGAVVWRKQESLRCVHF